ncbi:hypothetical protein HAX54_028604 [Datura stramonium]|uniref:Uncharacterized protein n=1 Tax=Datura stramonium TaxID=4076 RepID=A0ABS8V6N7_DATST|nr:hypothetical protein [Datura stramonium]
MEGEVGTSSTMAAASLKYEIDANNSSLIESKSAKFPLTFWEISMASGVVLSFINRDNLEDYTSDYTVQESPLCFHSVQSLTFSKRRWLKPRAAAGAPHAFLEVFDTAKIHLSMFSRQLWMCLHIFLLGTIVGVIPATYVTVRAGLTLGELQSVGDLYDFNSIATLFLIGLSPQRLNLGSTTDHLYRLASPQASSNDNNICSCDKGRC